MQASEAFYAHAQAARASTNQVLWTTFLVLLLVGGMILMNRHYRTTTPSRENYVGNVGNQGVYNVQREPEKKQLGCYNDMDCPDETKCSEEGLCVPIIHQLPRSRHMLNQGGRGREDEKST